MKKNLKTKQYILVCLVIILLLVRVCIAYKTNYIPYIIVPVQEKTQTKRTPEKSIVLVVGQKKIQLPIREHKTLIEDMDNAKDTIHFSGKNYTGLGFFVTDIEDLHSGNGMNLFYYVDGNEASVGVSSFIPTSNEVIEWKLQ